MHPTGRGDAENCARLCAVQLSENQGFESGNYGNSVKAQFTGRLLPELMEEAAPFDHPFNNRGSKNSSQYTASFSIVRKND